MKKQGGSLRGPDVIIEKRHQVLQVSLPILETDSLIRSTGTDTTVPTVCYSLNSVFAILDHADGPLATGQ
jgi:hypothetical protein